MIVPVLGAARVPRARIRACPADGGRVAGDPWVLLHGWGFGGAVMEPLARRLAPGRQVLIVDLPGIAPGEPPLAGLDLDRLADAVAAALPGPAHWLGWSLGGLVALAAAARHPARVRGVDLLAASPRFVAGADWPGIAPAELDGFAQAVAADPAAAHGRFLGFQLAGSEGARSTLRQLREISGREGRPAQTALAEGLGILRRCDLRAVLEGLSCPLRAILGGADPLVPASVAPVLGRMGVGVQVIEGAGHVPFLSHPDAVAAALDPPVSKREQ